LQINLATGDINDAGLQKTFLCLPKKCIVLIEDIDSAGVDREHGPSLQKPKVQPPMATDVDAAALEVPVPRPRRSTKSHDQSKRSVVTLSGLLNAIDGTSSQEGRLLIMTSNDPDALDPALTRPGRIDKKVYFGNLGKAASKSIFMRLMGRFAVAHDTTLSMDVIEKHADNFADRLPANVFTPAEIQNFLQDCRGDPVKALKGFDDWVTNHQDGFGFDVNGTGVNGNDVDGHDKSSVQHD
jgi:chaperone BCS1